MTHRKGGRAYDLHVSGIPSGVDTGTEIWGRQLTTRGGVKLGSKKGVILAAQNEPRSGVSSMVYLHAGLEIRSAIPFAIHSESNKYPHVLGS